MIYSKADEPFPMRSPLQVAFIHDWLVSYRGGEKVLETLLPLFPQAPIYTLFYKPEALPESFSGKDIRYPRGLQKFQKYRQFLLPFLPSVVEAWDLQKFDLIISTSSCVAKGVIPAPHAKHICYIHSPMRYIWDQHPHYFEAFEKIPLLRSFLNTQLTKLRVWDYVSSQRVDTFVANSEFVRQRVHRYYRREAEVLPPPVSVERFFNPHEVSHTKADYFLIAGAFVPYKRFDLAIEACKRLNQKLIVAGSGPEEWKLRKLGGTQTEFVIAPDEPTLIKLLRHAKAFLFPAVEDFGMLAVEALASQTPVIAYKHGGSRDFIIHEENGLIFEEQTVDSLSHALQQLKHCSFDPRKLEEGSQKFSQKHFLERFTQILQKTLEV